MTKLYSIPEIKWGVILLNQDEEVIVVRVTENTFIEYAIYLGVGDTNRCYYGNGRFRDFKTEDEAKEWVSEVHYPAQVAKYFKLVTTE